MLQIHIKLIGRFPTLLGSVALVSSLSLYYSYETKVSNNIKQVEENGQVLIIFRKIITKHLAVC